MKDIRKYKYSIAAMFSLLLLVLSGGCSKDEGGEMVELETQYATMVISLGALDNSTPAYTRAAGDNDIIDPDFIDDYFERYIKNWWIVVVNNNGIVDRVISDTKANNNPDQDNDTETEVEMELPIGETYTFYAFANLTELKSTVSIDGWEGKSFSELRKTTVELKDLSNYNGGNGTSYIPMSSYGEKRNVSEDINKNKVSLYLIRLFGKVSIDITNLTGVDLTVNNLTMGKFRRSGSIYLLPYDAIIKDPDKPNLLLGIGEENLMNPVFPEEVEGTDWSYTPTDENKTILKYDNGNENANKCTYTFYINETNQKSVGENGSDLEIALDVTGDGIEKDKERKSTNFFFVRRNDWLKIPISISNANVLVSFEQQHMPIGGLPARYEFKSGVDVASRIFETDHSGDITINYSLTSLNNSATGWKLKYYLGGTTTSADHYCYAALMSETEDNAQGYLLKPSKLENDKLDWWDVTYPATTKPTWAYVLHSATEDQPGTEYNEKEVSGSFTVTVQELSKASSATIKLNLVAEKDGVEVILPYTLVIRNKQEQGGN